MSKLLPDRYAGRDFFLADIAGVSIKDDIHSMEHPFFSLSKNPDTEVRRYEHNGNTLEIKPGSDGMPTIWDKDILIFIISQIMEAQNRGRSDAKERIVRFRAYDYFAATNREPSGASYDRLQQGLDRLAGTRIKTNIKAGKETIKENFGILDRWKIVEKSQDDSRMVAVEVQLSTWLYKAVQAKEVLTIHRDYFRLKGSMERRLYEICRKHCGAQPSWKIGVELLYKKTGSTGNIRDFRRMLRGIVASNVLPEYLVALDEESQIVTFTNRRRAGESIAGALKVIG